MAADEQKVIFSMVQVSRTYGQKTVLRDISLGFFYGAKIGVLGLNGSGKSTLLKIIAGKEENYLGEISHYEGDCLCACHLSSITELTAWLTS